MATRFVENFVHQLLNEIDKGDVSPSGGPDPKDPRRFPQFNLRGDEIIDAQMGAKDELQKAADMLPDIDAPRPSANRPDADKLDPRLKKEIDRLRKSRVRAAQNFEDYKDALSPALKPEDTKIKTIEDLKREMDKLRDKIKEPMSKLDAKRSASPSHRAPGTPKPPTPANDADLNFFTPEEEAELKKISGKVESAKKQIDVEELLKKNIEKAEKNFDETLKKAGIEPPKPEAPKGVEKLMSDIEAIEDITPEQEARRAKMVTDIEDAAEKFKSDMARQASRARAATEAPGVLSKVGSTVKAVATNPLARFAGKAAGVAATALAPLGIYADAQEIAKKLTAYEKEEMERRRLDPNRSVTTSAMTTFVRSPGTKF